MNDTTGGNRSLESFRKGPCEPAYTTACVANVMTTKVMTVRPHDSLADAFNLISNHHIHHLLVVDDENQLDGVLSDRDILWALSCTTNWHRKQLIEIMTRNPFTVSSETPVIDAVTKMVAKRINCLPVVADNGSVCGIVTSTDLLMSYKMLLESLEK